MAEHLKRNLKKYNGGKYNLQRSIWNKLCDYLLNTPSFSLGDFEKLMMF